MRNDFLPKKSNLVIRLPKKCYALYRLTLARTDDGSIHKYTKILTCLKGHPRKFCKMLTLPSI